MKIQQMFYDDIDRKINGVVKVDQSTADVLKQEVQEYVITSDIRKHIITFFNNYGESFNTPTADIGVWISGFFGSGKSHFLKMLSYLLENKEIDGKKVEDYFRDKFDDEATFMSISKALKGHTDTILFNIDVEGSIIKDATAVVRVFAKMFYNYLGFNGEDLKCAKLEQFIESKGKTQDFRRVFEQKNGLSWLESRNTLTFYEDDVVETMMEVLGMSEESARNWFSGPSEIENYSIAQFVKEIKAYIAKQPADFHLLFMIDEVGQYVGGSIDHLMNLQSLVEKIGSECNGKVWVVCTGQEAIDDIIKTRQNEFSRIQARFGTRLSLTSSSVDEVIQKRILRKKEDAAQELEQVYNNNDSVLRNLFTFKDAILDIKGYSGPEEFAKDFPFVPYQFIIMSKVFSEIRKHGNSGKHLSGGERSMLSGFQEAAQRIENKDEFALAPFYLFYDTVHTFLDSTIRMVIERCQRAADSKSGIEQQDVDVLKLLYLIRYIDDIKSNLDNIVILMADNIQMDKISMREQVSKSLDRLLSQNYIGRTGETYNFLTDEEQDIQREIKNTAVDTAAIVGRIGNMVFGDIYTAKKFHYGKYDFSFDQMVDNVMVGASTGGMKLKILTVAADSVDKDTFSLMNDSKQQSIVVLAETPYYELLENAEKIRKFIKQRNVASLPKSTQNIIQSYQTEAGNYEKSSKDLLEEAIVKGQFYVDGEKIEIKSGDAKSKIDQSLEALVTRVYSELGLITQNVDSDADIIGVLKGDITFIPGAEPNLDAAAKIEEYLEMQERNHLPTSMADIQSRYQAVPYGWREIDIANVVALLIVQQKVTIKFAGSVVRPEDPKMVEYLRKKSSIGSTLISKRQVVSAVKMNAAKGFLHDYLNQMSVPSDEDGLVKFIIDKFEELLKHYESIAMKYESHIYPDKKVVSSSISLIKGILAQQKDNMALIECMLNEKDELFNAQDAMQNVESFFKNQVSLFDAAVKFKQEKKVDLEYIKKDEEAAKAFDEICQIIKISDDSAYDYKRIPALNGLLSTVKDFHRQLLDDKRKELLTILGQCEADIKDAAKKDPKTVAFNSKAVIFYSQQQETINQTTCLAVLEGLPNIMWNYRDNTLENIKSALKPSAPEAPVKPVAHKNYKPVYRQSVFKTARLESDTEIDEYVETLREQLKNLIKGTDGIELK